MHKVALQLVWFIVLFLSLGMSSAQQEETHVLSGQVLDPEDEALPDVRIRLFRGSEPVKGGESLKDGSYSISFPPGKPIDVQYDRTDWEMSGYGCYGGRWGLVNSSRSISTGQISSFP